MSDQNSTLEFKLDRKTRPVRIGDKDYTLQEMDGQQRDAHQNEFITKRARFDEKGEVVGIKDFENMQANLISRCLVDAEGKRVAVEVIQKWPHSVINGLFLAAQQLNALDKKPEEVQAAAKNG